MAIVVVGASARGAGKTALVCGLIAALKEFDWIAVKITTHAHASLARIYEETASGQWDAGQSAAGQGTDTARYLAAGARRAFLLAADDAELGERLSEFGRLVEVDANLIFESNRVLRHLQPDLCLVIEPDTDAPRKSSFALVDREKQVAVKRAKPGTGERVQPGAHPVFELTQFEHLSEPMRQWLRQHLKLDR
jgi:molybdopterin-guanine dinucleotide biosynthesis protein